MSGRKAHTEKRTSLDVPRNSDEKVDPLVVVQRLDIESLDVSSPSRHRLATDRRSGQGRAGRDQSDAACSPEEGRSSTDADGRESGTETGADDGREEAGRETDHESAADGGETHHQVPLLSIFEPPTLEHFAVLFLLDGFLDFERFGQTALEPDHVHPFEPEFLGASAEQDSRPSVVDRVGNQSEEEVAEYRPSDIESDGSVEIGRVLRHAGQGRG